MLSLRRVKFSGIHFFKLEKIEMHSVATDR